MGRQPQVEPRSDLERIEIECFLLGIFRRYGYDLRGYDSGYTRDQIASCVREEGVGSISRLSEVMLRDAGLLERFLARFSVPSEALFEPPDFWSSFREKVIPYLRTYPTLRFWLLGARPEELYTLSILLEENLPRHVQIYATDIHDTLLDRARRGALPAQRMAQAVKAYRRSGGRKSLNRYFERSNGSAVFSSELRKKIVFGSHNPVTDGSFQQCHVVFARSTLDLFNEDLRARTYGLLHESTISLGFLALGPRDELKETPLKDCYKVVDAAAHLLQKVREQAF